MFAVLLHHYEWAIRGFTVKLIFYKRIEKHRFKDKAVVNFLRTKHSTNFIGLLSSSAILDLVVLQLQVSLRGFLNCVLYILFLYLHVVVDVVMTKVCRGWTLSVYCHLCISRNIRPKK